MEHLPSNMSDEEIAREVEHYLASSTTPDSVKMMFVRFSGLCAIAEELDERVDELEHELKREQDNHQETRSVLRTVHQWVQFYNQPQWRGAWEAEIPKMIGLTHEAMDKGKHLELEMDKIVKSKVQDRQHQFEHGLTNIKRALDDVIIALRVVMQGHSNSEYDDDIPF